MMDAQMIRMALLGFAVVAAGVAGCVAGLHVCSTLRRRSLKKRALGNQQDSLKHFAVGDPWAKVLAYLEVTTQKLTLGVAKCLFPKTFPRKWFDTQVPKTGLKEAISFEAFREASMRLGVAGLLAGFLFGSLISFELMVVIGLAAGVFGLRLPRLALAKQAQQRAQDLERELPELLEVVALGMRSGLSFDRSFALYAQHFDSAFSKECERTQSSWSLGLTTREAALRDFAATFDSVTFSRVVEMVIRALRFGSSLGGELEQVAEEARLARRSSKEEVVAKAPVKMMIPTGALILPAMLLMILGPVLLEMMNGF